jgi:hypothetical protein
MKEKKFKAIRKSAFMTFKQCPKRFEYLYNDPHYWDYGSTDDKSNMKTWRGNQFHDGVDNFWKKLEKWHYWKEDVIECNIPFGTMLPEHEDQLVNEWFDWFAEIERNRFNDLLDKNQLEYFKPVANELQVYYENTIDRTGHIDRIDRIGEKELCIVEYKAGLSYDMEIPDRLTSMNSEIGFYVQILNNTKVYPDDKITHWKVINPIHKKVWINKISPISLRTVEKVYADIVDRITNKKSFDRKVGPLCHHCPYMDDCDPFYGEELNITG